MDKFDIFFEKVQNTAKTMESKFFVQSSEGRDFETEEMVSYTVSTRGDGSNG